MAKLKGCVLRNKTYHARLVIPEDVRDHFGCREFTRTLNTADPYKAEKLAASLIVQWKELIQSARLSPQTTTTSMETRQEALERLRGMWRDTLKNDDPRTSEAMEFVVTDEMESLNLSFQEQKIVRGETISFSSQIEPYTSQLTEEGQSPKTIDDIRSICTRFARHFKTSSEVNLEEFRTFLKELPGRTGGSSASITQKLKVKNRLLQFLKFCGAKSLVNELSDIQFKTKRVKELNKSQPFTTDEIKLLLDSSASRSKDGEILTGLIMMALYTGARIEELCELLKTDINVASIRIKGTKTKASDRLIPIHPDLKPVIEYFKTSHNEASLIPGLTPDKYGKRSGAIGKKFGRLKTRLGFGAEHRFHSLRTTFLQALRNVGTPEDISALFAGHANSNLTYGYYANKVTPEVLDQMLHWLSRIHYNQNGSKYFKQKI